MLVRLVSFIDLNEKVSTIDHSNLSSIIKIDRVKPVL